MSLGKLNNEANNNPTADNICKAAANEIHETPFQVCL